MSYLATRTVGLAVAAGLVFSACTGQTPDPDASDSPSSDPTPAASASPSPSEPAKPERPAAMDRDDAEGAAAAAEYFLSLYAYTKATGDTEEWDAMSHRACEFCEVTSDRAKQIAQNRESFTGGELTMSVLKTYARDALTGIYPLDARLSQAAYTTRSSAGEVIAETQQATDDRRIEIGRQNDRWVVVTVAPIPGAES